MLPNRHSSGGVTLWFDLNCSIAEACSCSALTEDATGGTMLSGLTIIYVKTVLLFSLKVLPAYARVEFCASYCLACYGRSFLKWRWEIWYWDCHFFVEIYLRSLGLPFLPEQIFMLRFRIAVLPRQLFSMRFTPLFMGAESCEKSESLQTFFATFLMYALYGSKKLRKKFGNFHFRQ